jgi:hypothetical protein
MSVGVTFFYAILNFYKPSPLTIDIIRIQLTWKQMKLNDSIEENYRREVNKRNALASTGPVTRPGKLRVRRNALKHGLAAGPLAQKFPKRRINRIVEAVISSDANPGAKHAVAEFAVAHLYWLRVISVRKKLMRRKLEELGSNCGLQGSAAEALVMSDPGVAKLDRYERRAFRRRLHAALAVNLGG